MSSKKHKSYNAKLKAKIALEVLKNDSDILEICQIPKTNARFGKSTTEY